MHESQQIQQAIDGISHHFGMSYEQMRDISITLLMQMIDAYLNDDMMEVHHLGYEMGI